MKSPAPCPDAIDANPRASPPIGFLFIAINNTAPNGNNNTYPKLLSQLVKIHSNEYINTTTNFGTFFVILLHKVFKKPDFNAIAKPIDAISKLPNGSKLIKLLYAEDIINFNPSKLNNELIAIVFDSTSPAIVVNLSYVT